MTAALALLVVAALGANGADSGREPSARRTTDDRYNYGNTTAGDRYANNQPATIRRDEPASVVRGSPDPAQGDLRSREWHGQETGHNQAGAGTTLRDGIEAGIQAAGQTLGTDRLSPLPEREANSSLPPLPPWTPPAGSAATQDAATGSSATGSSGSSAAASTAAPPLANPSAPSATTSTVGGVSDSDSTLRLQPLSASEGPPTAGNTTLPASDDRYRTDPAPVESGRATIRRSDDVTERRPSDLELVPVQPPDVVRGSPDPAQGDLRSRESHGQETGHDQTAAGRSGDARWADPWSGPDPWGRSQTQPPSGPTQRNQPPADDVARGTPNHAQGDVRSREAAGAASPQASPWPSAPATSGQTLDAPGTSGPPRVAAALAPPQTVSPNDKPWMPLVLVGFGLAGSIGANLFLGWSYLDARRRYSSLAQKTADTFRHAREAA
jgi:hypothetical protein